MTETLNSILDGNDELESILVTDGLSYTRLALRSEIAKVAYQLRLLGIGKGDVVTLSFGNDIELIICFLAATSLGAVAAPLNASYKAKEVEFYLSDLSSTILLIPRGGNKNAEHAAALLNIPVAVAISDDNGLVTLQRKTGCNSRDTGDFSSSPAINPEDVALFLHTSGTTGKPKGVPLSHRNMMTTVRNITACYRSVQSMH